MPPYELLQQQNGIIAVLSQNSQEHIRDVLLCTESCSSSHSTSVCPWRKRCKYFSVFLLFGKIWNIHNVYLSDCCSIRVVCLLPNGIGILRVSFSCIFSFQLTEKCKKALIRIFKVSLRLQTLYNPCSFIMSYLYSWIVFSWMVVLTFCWLPQLTLSVGILYRGFSCQWIRLLCGDLVYVSYNASWRLFIHVFKCYFHKKNLWVHRSPVPVE